MSDQAPAKKTRRRNPRPEIVGMSLRVTPEELEAIKQAAASDNRPASIFARLAVMRGLHEFQRDRRALTDKTI